MELTFAADSPPLAAIAAAKIADKGCKELIVRDYGRSDGDYNDDKTPQNFRNKTINKNIKIYVVHPTYTTYTKLLQIVLFAIPGGKQ